MIGSYTLRRLFLEYFGVLCNVYMRSHAHNYIKRKVSSHVRKYNMLNISYRVCIECNE